MHFCCYLVLSNGPNLEYFSIISIFGDIFGQNLGIWPPGVPIYEAAPNCYAIHIEYILSRFNLNAFCGFFWAIFWPKLGLI